MIVKRGDIFYADLSPVVGSEQGGLRPVLIVQNDVGNRYSPTVIAAAITSKTGKAKLPTHIDVSGDNDEAPGLARDSVILLEQVRTIDKRRLRERIGHLDLYTMQKVNSAISVSLGLMDEHSVYSFGGESSVLVEKEPMRSAVASVGNNASAISENIEKTPILNNKTDTAASLTVTAAESGKDTIAAVTGDAAVNSEGNATVAKNTPIPPTSTATG